MRSGTTNISPADVSLLRPTTEKRSVLAQSKAWDPIKLLPLFEAKFPREMKLFIAFGIHPTSKSGLSHDPFNNCAVDEDFSNIGEHGLAVAICAAILALSLSQHSGISASEIAPIVRRALLHDILKPFDIFLQKALRNGVVSEAAYYSENVFSPIKSTLLAQNFNNEEAEALINDYGWETNVRTCFQRFLYLNEGNKIEISSQDFGSALVHLADNMTCSPLPSSLHEDPQGSPAPAGTYFLTCWERCVVTDLDRRYPWATVSGFGFDQAKKPVHLEVWDYPPPGGFAVLPYHTLMVWFSHQIARHIETFHGREPSEKADYFVKDLVNSTHRSEEDLAEILFATL